MPAQTSKTATPIAAILRGHAKDKVDYGQDFSSLPGGITGGIAELVAIEFSKFKKGDNVGKPFFMARGTVIRPLVAVETVSKFENGKVRIVSQQEVSVKGRQTKVGPIALCATKSKGNPPKVTTVEDAYVQVINELKKLGGEDCTASLADLPENFTEAQCIEALKEIGKALVDAKIRFRFNTRQGQPNAQYPDNPRVWEEWKGTDGVEDVASSPGSGVEDSTGGGESSNGEHEEAPPESADSPPAEETQEDLGDILAACNANDVAAQKRIIEIAVESGVDKDTAEGAATWEDVVALIEEARGGGGEEVEAPEEEAEPEPWKPLVGEEYEYTPPVKNKAGKWVKGTKSVTCKVSDVDEKAETVTLVNGKTKYPKVKWAAIAPTE